MADQRFAHLHVHTEYSILDGAARIRDMMAEVQRQGAPAIAITDHGNVHGTYAFFQAARAAGVTPVIGMEAYVAPGSRFDRKPVRWGRADQRDDDVSGAGKFTHLTMWAVNAAGLHNLFRLSSLASIEGQYGKPRVDEELLAKYADGIVASTGCPSGEVQTRLRLGQVDEAYAAAARLRDIFGPSNLFVELMDHGLDIERRVRDGLVDIARRLDLRPLVTNDSHYTTPDQASAHDALLCVQTQATVAEPKRFKFDGDGYHLKTAEQMYAIDASDIWQEGCRNTLLVAEQVDTAGMFKQRNLMAEYPVPSGETENSWLTRQVWEGMARRYPAGVPDDRRARCEYEMDIITSLGYAGYFLVVADLIAWAKDNDVRVGPGRGSAAGAIVAYALGITDLDPVTHGLIFERFLNPERVQMPDIDIDFDERGRSRVIEYVTGKYGADRVGQIGTVGTIKAKAAVKDAARVLGFPYSVGDRITKAMPPAVMGKDAPLAAITDPQHPRYAEAAEVRSMAETEPDVAKILDVARGLEGLVRQTGIHAAGIIIASEPLLDHVPVLRTDDGAIVTQYDHYTCDNLGLVKMDFLGLRNLTILADAISNVQATRSTTVDLLSVPLNDKPTYELLTRGETLGVFQLDGGAMRALLRLMRPDSFEDISAALALYRPGPMGANAHTNYALRKTGQQPVMPIHPELAEPLADILNSTYGLIVYQEQVQLVAQRVAGYSLGKADLLRRAMGKKKKEILDKEYGPFSEGMRANGYSDDAIKTLWDILVPFSDYAFNKAHTAAYGLIAYWTAYLKANYPSEYMAALLTSVGGDKDKSAVYLAECRRMGITVLPPDVNESSGPFRPVGGAIRFGLQAIRNIGPNVVESLVANRAAKGLYASFGDFMSKVDLVVCNKRTVDSLIKAGAFDSLQHTRRGLAEVHEQAVEAATLTKRKEADGQFDLFGGLFSADDEAPVGLDLAIGSKEWDSKTLLALEREMLGLYVSSHPLAGTERHLKKAAEHVVIQIDGDEMPGGANVVLAGLITGVTRKVTKHGKTWAVATLEDMTGGVEVLFFPATYELVCDVLVDDRVIAVRGKVNRRDGSPVSVIASDARPLEIPQDNGSTPVVVTAWPEQMTPTAVYEFRQTLTGHPGNAPVHVVIRSRTGSGTLYDMTAVRVTPAPSLYADIKALFGQGSLTQ